MFVVEEYNSSIEAKTLEHCSNIFLEALKDGERYYHVHNVKGQDYDILYKGNTEWYGDKIPAYIGKVTPEYIEYDENDKDSIDTEFLNAYSQYICMKLTEYSIVMTRIILKYTDSHVYFMDPRVLWFVEPSERLHIEQMPQITDTTLYLVGALGRGFTKGASTNKISDILMFNSAFYMQDLLKGRKKSQIKYLENPVGKSLMGIGGILINTSCYKEFARQCGLKLIYNHDTIGKFKVNDLKEYFNISDVVSDSTKENTLVVENTAGLFITWRFYNIPSVMSKDMLVDRFVNELDEYVEAVVGDKKALGILIRGTDYKSTGLDGARAQATVEEMAPAIQKWIDDYGYEKIVLATEDQDILNQMRDLFGKKVIAIAQERHTVDEFHKGQVINELEKELYSEEEYDKRVIETNINYFYALYMLSKCNGFMCSGQNNGWDTVNAMNAGTFEHVCKFVEGRLPDM